MTVFGSCKSYRALVSKAASCSMDGDVTLDVRRRVFRPWNPGVMEKILPTAVPRTLCGAGNHHYSPAPQHQADKISKEERRVDTRHGMGKSHSSHFSLQYSCKFFTVRKLYSTELLFPWFQARRSFAICSADSKCLWDVTLEDTHSIEYQVPFTQAIVFPLSLHGRYFSSNPGNASGDAFIIWLNNSAYGDDIFPPLFLNALLLNA